MNLSKQLYSIILFIFTLIFVGNFTISINNFKSYLEIESKTKSQDTATLLGMNLKTLIQDKTDPEILSTISAIANRGFYKEIRLEDVEFKFSKNDLLKKYPEYKDFEIKNITIDKKDGELTSSKDDLSLENELLEIEGGDTLDDNSKNINYSFVPSSSFDQKILNISFTAYKDDNNIDLLTTIAIDKVLVKVTKNEKFDTVPQWFIDFIHIKSKESFSEISDGWKTSAIIYVSSNAGDAYSKLYQQAISTLYYSLISFAISFAILIVFLRLILKPLKEIDNLAKEISNGKFKKIDNIPWTTELKNVSLSMNNMSSKVEEIFKKSNDSAKRNRELLYYDPVTKLYNRRYLTLKIPDMIQIENKTGGGSILFIALDGAAVINQIVGRQKADKLFLELANSFHKICKNFDDRVIARVNGTEFTLMLPDCEADFASDIARRINRSFDKLLKAYDLISSEIFISIGIYRYNNNATTKELLISADNALSIAKSKENDNTHLYEEETNKNTLAKEQWREIFDRAIENNYFKLKFWSTINTKTKTVNYKVATFIIDDIKDNKKYFYGDFIAPALNLGLVSKIYIIILNKIFIENLSIFKSAGCSIRLPNEFLKENSSIHQLESLFKQYSKNINFELIFEISNTFAIHNIEITKSFVELFNKYNYSFGINSFAGESDDYTYLKTLNPKFIKSDCTFLLDQSYDAMNSLQIITESLSIDIIATLVNNSEQLDGLEKLNIFNIQGAITDKII
jgi:diguanylate cyclase (GGDEF)-like protein